MIAAARRFTRNAVLAAHAAEPGKHDTDGEGAEAILDNDEDCPALVELAPLTTFPLDPP